MSRKRKRTDTITEEPDEMACRTTGQHMGVADESKARMQRSAPQPQQCRAVALMWLTAAATNRGDHVATAPRRSDISHGNPTPGAWNRRSNGGVCVTRKTVAPNAAQDHRDLEEYDDDDDDDDGVDEEEAEDDGDGANLSEEERGR